MPVLSGAYLGAISMAAQIHTALTILRRKQVEFRTGLSRSTIYERVRAGTFPAPVELGSRHAVGWLEAEIDQWIHQQVANRRRPASSEPTSTSCKAGRNDG